MSARTNKFYQDMQLKDQRTSLRHELGMGKKPTRSNPILCQQTPRKNEQGFNFTPPPATIIGNYHELKYSKWKYPEVDSGLMSQLPSQKHKFELFNKKEMEFKKYMEINASTKASTVSSRPTSTNEANSGVHLNSTSRSQQINETDESEPAVSSRTTSRSTNSSRLISNENTSRSTSRGVLSKIKEGTDFYDQPVTDFKKTLNSNEDILKIYRANRAARFIEKQTDKYKSPIMYDESSSSNKKTNSTIANPDLNTLLNELNATEDQIQKLTLKVGLKAKTKGYQRPTSHTTARRPSF